MRCVLACAFLVLACAGAAHASNEPQLVPAPNSLAVSACGARSATLDRPLRFPASVDPGGFDLVRERWSALGAPAPIIARSANVLIVRTPGGARESYDLTVRSAGVTIRAGDDEAVFDALATLAQLPLRRGAHWRLPCVRIHDAPALRWRIVSDDISRGPFPTMRYFHERIRTLASMKINGWSPYMEQVFADPAYPYVAFPDALSAAQLHELTIYARRYHVALIPEQQTFAHMHESLKYETLAPLAELPHGYLLAESDPATYAYLAPLLRAERAASDNPPFFHLGADEPLDLGRGRTPRTAQVFADHVRRVAAIVSGPHTRPMIWDDAVQQDPSILPLLPKTTVIVSFHYGAEKSFAKYIARVAAAGFDQMVSPGANNWNEIYDDLGTAYANEAQFLADGKAAHVLGMFETVWHDDGETLFEATWAPVAFAAASAWQTRPVDRATWHATFAHAFFGTDDPRYGADLDALQAIREKLRTPPASDPPDYLFWSNPFNPSVQARAKALDLAGLRVLAEGVMAHLATAEPPLHANAARVMRLAALRYDTLGRRLQIGGEARAYYDDARAHAVTHDDGPVYRGLNVAKYLCLEMRDEMTALAPLYAQVWDYEDTPGGRERVLARYRIATDDAIRAADRINVATREHYLRTGTLPTFDTLMGLAP